MLVGDLKEALESWDDGMEVVVRVNLGEDENGDTLIEDIMDIDGEYLDVVDDRSVLEESGRVVIIADLAGE